MKAKLTFADIGVTVTVPAGTRIIEVSEKVGAGIEYGCRESDCGTCLTEVVSGMAHLSEKSTFEVGTLAQHKAGPNVRLACQTLVLGDAVVRPRASVHSRSGAGSATGVSSAASPGSAASSQPTLCKDTPTG